MPKIVTKQTRLEIIEFAKDKSQPETAKHFRVSRMFVNALVNDRPITRTRPPKYKCPITGF